MSSKPPEAPTFFIDRDLGVHFAASLAADDRFIVESYDAHFPDPKTDDSVWLQFIARKRWIGVTHDKKIRQQHRTIIAGFRARVIIVVGRRPLAEQAAIFIATSPRI
jgi:hypothetical protein